MIVIAPTWRNNLAPKNRSVTDEQLAIPFFNQSSYFIYYNRLINDIRLSTFMKSKGYRGLFVLHPNFLNQWRDFSSNEIFAIHHGWINYQDMYITASLLITDYSSIAFDFAYLKKPVIYTQFDHASFLHNHIIGKGYFDFYEHGFGPVATDINSTVDSIINIINSGCSLKDPYLSRVNTFFAFFDGYNSHRIYRHILSIPFPTEASPKPIPSVLLYSLVLITIYQLFLICTGRFYRHMKCKYQKLD